MDGSSSGGSRVRKGEMSGVVSFASLLEPVGYAIGPLRPMTRLDELVGVARSDIGAGERGLGGGFDRGTIQLSTLLLPSR